jgi:hypothetical protein
MFIYLIHWLLVGPLFLYIGLMKERVDPKVYPLMTTLGVIGIVYHFYRWYINTFKTQKVKNI